MQDLYKNEKFEQEAKWRPWIKGISETMDKAAERDQLSGNDPELYYFLNGGATQIDLSWYAENVAEVAASPLD
jgi:hypothetical protein